MHVKTSSKLYLYDAASSAGCGIMRENLAIDGLVSSCYHWPKTHL